MSVILVRQCLHIDRVYTESLAVSCNNQSRGDAGQILTDSEAGYGHSIILVSSDDSLDL